MISQKPGKFATDLHTSLTVKSKKRFLEESARTQIVI